MSTENKKTSKFKIIIIVIGIVLSLSMLSGKWVLFYDTPIKGYVVDAETGKPLENVIVVGLWQLSQFMSQGFGGYAKIVLVETDKEGKFTLPIWVTFKPWTLLSSMRDLAPQIVIYKPGFKLLYTGREALIDYDKTTLPESEKELHKQMQINQRIDPARLNRIYTDEERLLNYDEFEMKANFPSYYYSIKEKKRIRDELKREISALSEMNRRKQHLIKNIDGLIK